MMDLAKRSLGRAGFAFVELLLSMSILVIILGIALPFLITAEKGWRQSQSALDALQNARTAVNTIEEGLRRAVAMASISDTQIVFDVDEWTFGEEPDPWHGAVARTIRTTYKAVTQDDETIVQLLEEDPDTGEVRAALVAGPLEALQFVGYREDGVTTTTDPLQIRSVEITVGIESPGSPDGRIRYSSRVLCRCDTTPAFAVLSTNTSSVTFDNQTKVCGDVFVGGTNGDVAIPQGSKVVDGRVYATGAVTGAGRYQRGRLWAPNPTLPPLDTSYYDGLLAQAGALPQWNLEMRGGGSYSDTAYYQGIINQAAATSPWDLEVRAGDQYEYLLSDGQPDPVDYSALLAAADATPRWDLEIRASGTYDDTAFYQDLVNQAAQEPAGNMDIQGNFPFPPGRVLVNGNVWIRSGANLGGPGSLIATGNIYIEGNVTLNGGAEIVAGQTIESSGALGGSGQTLLYALQAPVGNSANLYLNSAPTVAAGSTSVHAMSVKGDVWLRGGVVLEGAGFLVARREGSLQDETAVGGNVTFEGAPVLDSDVSVLASDAIACPGAVRGSGGALLYGFKQTTVDVSAGNLLVKGDVWLRGATVMTGPGTLAVGKGGNRDVLIHDNTSLENGVAIAVTGSADCHGSMRGAGDSLVYARNVLLDLTAGTLLVNGDFWMRGANNTSNPPTVITGPGTLVAADRVDIDNATRLTQDVNVIGRWVELTHYVSAEAETILYGRDWTDLDGYATLMGAMVSPNACDIDTQNRVRGYIYSGGWADIRGEVDWTLPDGTRVGGQVICGRIQQLRGAGIRYEEKPMVRDIPGLSL